MHPDALLISPGPGYPNDAGISIPAIQKFAGKMPILGICLGHQAIAEAFGGKIVKAEHLMHGKASNIAIDNQSVLFARNKYKYTLTNSPFADGIKRSINWLGTIVSVAGQSLCS